MLVYGVWKEPLFPTQNWISIYCFSGVCGLLRINAACFTSQPILRRKPWSSLEIPPITATVRMPSGLPNLMVSSSICCANSRVGARITAYGPWSESSILHNRPNREKMWIKKEKEHKPVKRKSWVQKCSGTFFSHLYMWLLEPRLSHLSIFGRVVIQTSSGIRKAAVLPLPVSATPMMSRFCKPIGMACLWIGVGSWIIRRKKILVIKFT